MMYFGGVNGYNVFYPDQVKDNAHVPPVIITDFKLYDEPVSFETAIFTIPEIELSYQDDFFGFEFAALDFTRPEKNQYAYMLKGFDKDWIYPKQGFLHHLWHTHPSRLIA